MTKKYKVSPYFTYNGDLHKRLTVSRANDIMTALHYKSGKVVKLQYSEVRNNSTPTFTSKQVAALINRHRVTLGRAVSEGKFQPAEKVISPRGNPGGYRYSVEDVLRVWDYFSTLSPGRPNPHGIQSNRSMPTRRELKAKMLNEPIFYMEKDGEVTPTWKLPF